MQTSFKQQYNVIIALMVTLSLFVLVGFIPESNTLAQEANSQNTEDASTKPIEVGTSSSFVSGSAVSCSGVVLKAPYSIKQVSRKRYAKKEIKIHQLPKKSSYLVGKVKLAGKVKVIGKVKGKKKYSKYVLIKYKKKTGFVKKKYLTKSKPFVWKGTKLNRYNGVVQGPTGKETYYNDPMGHLVARLHRMGKKGKYWVRKDGVKMFGKYVMVAANLRLHPRGSKVKTTLGEGIVADTGGFARYRPTWLDIAVSWPD